MTNPIDQIKPVYPEAGLQTNDSEQTLRDKLTDAQLTQLIADTNVSWYETAHAILLRVQNLKRNTWDSLLNLLNPFDHPIIAPLIDGGIMYAGYRGYQSLWEAAIIHNEVVSLFPSAEELKPYENRTFDLSNPTENAYYKKVVTEIANDLQWSPRDRTFEKLTQQEITNITESGGFKEMQKKVLAMLGKRSKLPIGTLKNDTDKITKYRGRMDVLLEKYIADPATIDKVSIPRYIFPKRTHENDIAGNKEQLSKFKQAAEEARISNTIQMEVHGVQIEINPTRLIQTERGQASKSIQQVINEINAGLKSNASNIEKQLLAKNMIAIMERSGVSPEDILKHMDGKFWFTFNTARHTGGTNYDDIMNHLKNLDNFKNAIWDTLDNLIKTVITKWLKVLK